MKDPLPHAEKAGWAGWIFLLALACVLVVRIRLLEVPLERDEGEYAYSGWLILQGTPPFAEACNMKMPGIYYAYAAVMALFGQTVFGIHLGLLILNIATAGLVVLLGRAWCGLRVGLLAGAGYAILSLSPSVLGLFAHASHFVTLFGLAGLVLVSSAMTSHERGQGGLAGVKLLFAGLCFGLSFMMKQHGIFFALVGFIDLVLRLRAGRAKVGQILLSATIFSLSAVLPFAVTCAMFLRAGLFGDFWLWTFTYARQYVGQVPLSGGAQLLAMAMKRILVSNSGLWAFALLGFLGMFWNERVRRWAPRLILLLAGSFLLTCPGLYFRKHYFIPLLPAIALLAGAGVEALRGTDEGRNRRTLRVIGLVLFTLAMLQPFWQEAGLFFRYSPDRVSRTLYGSNPFPESRVIADYIAHNTKPEDRVIILGSEPQINFLARRRSATRFMYMYPLVESQPFALKMQKELIAEAELRRPAMAVVVKVWPSWLYSSELPVLLFDWMGRWLEANYERVGLIDLGSPSGTTYAWGAEAAAAPRSEAYVEIFKVKPAYVGQRAAE